MRLIYDSRYVFAMQKRHPSLALRRLWGDLVNGFARSIAIKERASLDAFMLHHDPLADW